MTDLLSTSVALPTVHFVPLVSVEVREDATVAVLQPSTGHERAFLENLANRRFGLPTVDFVFGLTFLQSRLESVVRTFDGGQDRFTLSLGSDRGSQGDPMEMSTNGVSADEIATMRARRILLDERPAPAAPRQFGFGNDSMLETLVRGMNTQTSVERSPLPELYRSRDGANKAHFLAAAKLTAVLWLRITGTVASVYDLELQLKPGSKLAVQFRGARARVYTNKEPESITVEGVCPLE